jgi:hypothetical protein
VLAALHSKQREAFLKNLASIAEALQALDPKPSAP